MSLGPRFQKLSFSRTSFRQEYLNRNAIRNIFKEKILPEITLFACAIFRCQLTDNPPFHHFS